MRTKSALKVCRDGISRPIPRKRTKEESIELFWKNVAKKGPLDCWVWTGLKGGSMGYGKFWDNGNEVRAHRFSFEIHKGPIPLGHKVLHTCDNPPCCNPAHLFSGTQKQNLHDAIAKKRHAHGTSHKNALLIDADVLAIRAAYQPRVVSFQKLADQYGVSPSTIQGIVERKTWKHL